MEISAVYIYAGITLKNITLIENLQLLIYVLLVKEKDLIICIFFSNSLIIL